MKLIVSAASPFVRKVRVLIRECGLEDQIEEVPVATTPLNTAAEVAAANPLGKIPVLIRPEGAAIYDSRVICRYLDEHAGGKLYPANGLYDVLTLEATGDAIMEAAVSMTYEVRLRPENEQSPAWVEAQWSKAARAIETLNARWMSHLSAPLNMGQISVACALSYVDLRHDARNWRANCPELAAWHAAFTDRPSFAQTNPD